MSSSAHPLLRLRGLSKRFGDTVVLNGVSLDVHKGETVCVIGPSGSGKSTLLRCVNHLEIPDEGDILLDGRLMGCGRRDVVELRRRVGMVFQQFNLFPHLTALENVTLGPMHGLGQEAHVVRARSLALLERVGVVEKRDEYPDRLSGGQQQRVAIARALAMEPELILFDEPTSALDPERVGEVLAVMRELVDAGATMVVVTHEMQFARDAADRIVFMDDGVILADGPPDTVLLGSGEDRITRFLARLNASEPSRTLEDE